MFCIKIINCSYWLALWRDYHLYSFLITLTFFFVAENYYIFVEVWHDVYFIHEWKWFKSETYKVSGCLSSYCGPVIWQYWFAWIGISLVGPSECLYRSSIGLSELSKKTPVCCKITEGKVGDGYIASSKWKLYQGLSIERMEEFFTFLVKEQKF